MSGSKFTCLGRIKPQKLINNSKYRRGQEISRSPPYQQSCNTPTEAGSSFRLYICMHAKVIILEWMFHGIPGRYLRHCSWLPITCRPDLQRVRGEGCWAAEVANAHVHLMVPLLGQGTGNGDRQNVSIDQPVAHMAIRIQS
jgi:hypothetical protein